MPNNIVIKKVLLSNRGVYAFTNSFALTYWNALTVANGSEVSGSVYSISTSSLKRHIDTFFNAGPTWLGNMTGMYTYIGGTSATHAVNAINPGTFNLTFIGSPTQSASGLGALNGTTQYARTGIIDSTVFSANNIHLASLSATNSTATSRTNIGATVSATQRSHLSYNSALLGNRFETYNSTTGSALGATNQSNGFIVGSRIASNDSKVYLNGVQDGTLATVGGTQPNIEFYIGANNSAGSPATFSNYLYKFHSIGTGLTSAKVTSFNSAVLALQTALGR